MIRLLDFVLSFLGLLFGFPVLLVLWVVGFLDTGSPVFTQKRVGKDKKPFILVKFRTMNKSTASVASHLASQSDVTAYGRFLRKTKFDELPQLWNVLKGDMSLVGPRPGLYNQEELTCKRDRLNVFRVRPGITGLAQIKKIDMSTPELLAETDARMIANMSVSSYFYYLLMTFIGKGSGDRIRP